MATEPEDRSIICIVVGVTTLLLITAGLIWEQYSAMVGGDFFLLLQIFLTVYGLALKSETGNETSRQTELFDSAVFLTANIVVLPLSLRAAYHAFHAEAFVLGSSRDAVWNWILYVINEVLDAVTLGIPGTFSWRFTDIEHSGHYGPFIASYVRLVVVAQFIAIISRLRRQPERADQQTGLP